MYQSHHKAGMLCCLSTVVCNTSLRFKDSLYCLEVEVYAAPYWAVVVTSLVPLHNLPHLLPPWNCSTVLGDSQED